jgi:hypothetical protein
VLAMVTEAEQALDFFRAVEPDAETFGNHTTSISVPSGRANSSRDPRKRGSVRTFATRTVVRSVRGSATLDRSRNVTQPRRGLRRHRS